MLAVNELSLAIDEQPIFQPVSFTLKPGELLYVRGENGKGKTSLFKSLLGLFEREVGEIEFNHPKGLSLKESAGFIGHKLALKPQLSVAENLDFLRFGEQSMNSLKQALNSVGLLQLADCLVSQLSEGQKKRASLARFFYISKALWLLDEPFSALDMQYQQRLIHQIASYVQSGGMVILSSHLAFEFKGQNIKELILK